MGRKAKKPPEYSRAIIAEAAADLSSPKRVQRFLEFCAVGALTSEELGGIGAVTEQALRKILGTHTVYQQLAYLMRSGEPDALDRMVASSYANIATDMALRKEYGRMVALRDGKYATVPIETLTQGVKRVDVAELYDIERYRPKVGHLLGKPMFLS